MGNVQTPLKADKMAEEIFADQIWSMLSEIGVNPVFTDDEGYEMDADGVLIEVARIAIERHRAGRRHHVKRGA